jgi:hypothetical protein
VHGDGSKLLRYEPSGGNMITRTRCLVTAFVCVTGLCASFATLSGVSGAGTKIPSVNGIWLTYSWANGSGLPSSPNQVFILRDKPGSTHITGTWGEFKVVGTFSPTTGKATLIAGLQPGTTQTTNFSVTFVFNSVSTAQTNHPKFSGTFDYVERATGQPVPHSSGKSKGTRCAYQTTAKALALCGI